MTLACAGAQLAAPPARAAGYPFAGRAMWIWHVDRSAGGNLAAIVGQARAAGVTALYVKSSDGTNVWSQFSPALVQTLHADGMRVCAWQYVYGADPLGEAAQGARAVADGADCLIVDAEAEYQGRYASAQAYLRALRARVGSGYPLGLASFPYVDYHPAFPYSVFLGPSGAQFDLPQMYWGDIGASVADVFHHTYLYNRVYGRAIVPVGQLYGLVPASDVQSFRASTVRYRAPGVAWWDFAWASASALWPSVGGYFGLLPSVAPLGYPALGPNSKGDDVVWLQEHLARAYSGQQVTGLFGAQTLANLEALQRAHGLPVSGRTDAATWHVVSRYSPVVPSWGGATTATASSASRGPRAGRSAPASARLPALRDEIPRLGGAAAPAGLGDPS